MLDNNMMAHVNTTFVLHDGKEIRLWLPNDGDALERAIVECLGHFGDARIDVLEIIIGNRDLVVSREGVKIILSQIDEDSAIEWLSAFGRKQLEPKHRRIKSAA